MDQIITSATNPAVKHLKKLVTSAKTRREEGLAVAEGIHLVRSLLESPLEVKAYFCAQSATENSEVNELIQRLDDQDVRPMVLADSLFESVSTVHANVGICAVFTLPATKNTDDALNQSAVLLEDIQDPGNLGTILRTTAAVGVKAVFLSADCASPWSPKALRAGMGAQFGLNIQENTDLATVVTQATVPTFATTLSEQSQELYSLDLRQPAAWIFGNEGQGVSQQLTSIATTQVHIPQVNTSVESLNVAAATAVCLYEQYRQAR